MSARARRRAVTGLTVAAAALVWLVADPLLGYRLRIAQGERTLDIGAVAVVLIALLASLAAWGLLAALERCGVRRVRAVWTGAAVTVLALSALPLTGDGMTAGTRTALALMHLTVAAVLIPGLRATAAAATPGARTARMPGTRRTPRTAPDGDGSAGVPRGGRG
ncbi:DUF6069 family protein [Streptomyces sp. WMMC500]|uniref:DUF6069 family protein n=1 Tax=Streptomyces sp. WMMC500 TaxID=3015154 RepID=UPI00248C19D4|nr:DUF6069 family protein [Streptomyces sp. WMMC500]WBB59645.1 DUF6069 family protein [Streptomyces sp. WMMC500]